MLRKASKQVLSKVAGSLSGIRGLSSLPEALHTSERRSAAPPDTLHLLRTTKALPPIRGFLLAHTEKLIRLDPLQPLELSNLAPTFSYEPAHRTLLVGRATLLTPAAKALYEHVKLYQGLEVPWLATTQHGSRWLDKVVGSGTFLTPVCKDAAGQPIRVLATAAHVSHDSSSSKMGDTSLDVYVGTDPRPPDGEALLEEFNSAPVFSSYVPHTDISRAVKQQYIREPNGWEISPADGSSISEGANLEQLRIKHAPNTAFLTATATSGLLASSQAPGRLHFSVPSLARPSFVSMLGFPGLADAALIAKAYGHSVERAQALALAISTKFVQSGRLVVAPGALLASDGRFIQTSVSAVAGNSGSAVCPIDNPNLLLGVHVGGASGTSRPGLEYNVATSVLHPLWALGYVQTVLPHLLHCTQWPSQDMPHELAGWLIHHQPMLTQHGCWAPCAKAFVAEHQGR